MTDYRPIFAMGSLGAGIAVTLFALHLQSDRFALITRIGRTVEVPASEMLALAIPPGAKVDHSSLGDKAREAGALQTKPASPLARKPQARRSAAEPLGVQPVRECNPLWRELESGPAGRRVREIC